MKFSVEAVVFLFALIGTTQTMKHSKKYVSVVIKSVPLYEDSVPLYEDSAPLYEDSATLDSSNFEAVPEAADEIKEFEANVEERGEQSTSHEESDEEEAEFQFSFSKYDISKAWDAADHLDGRNPSIWRLDDQNNIILSRKLTLSSPLSFQALIRKNSNGEVSFEAVQKEYYGADNLGNHKNALKYIAKDQTQDDLLSLIEIAILGHVSDNNHDPFCWCPSSIHRDLFERDVAARRWHKKIFESELKYGMAGHNLAFNHMGVFLKDVRSLPERTLEMMDQKNTFLFIRNFQPECSEAVGLVVFNEDPATREEKIKTNWGLPRVAKFVERLARSSGTSVPSSVLKKSIISKSKSKTLSSSIASPPPKNTATGSLPLSENDWPSLSSASSSEQMPKRKSKPQKPGTYSNGGKYVLIEI